MLVDIFGLFMTPVGWTWAAVVWGCALACFVVSDGVKLLTYCVFDLASGTVEQRFADGQAAAA